MTEAVDPIQKLLATPKFYIVDRLANTITHRELTKFELRNKDAFQVSKSHHGTFEKARAELLRVRHDEQIEAERELEKADRRLEAAASIKEESIR
ncbi:hypothetical protein E8K88_16525 [Lampropedia aestuarii]|uniref:Uncharacterized protein n=1 Tax=Lampropedia aestuarii TaxID=2562762 RepID=A0A4S5BMM7_9BURK|nr:hypothetical protein [Lampropedia aestuarii]THJ30968.1 hypothetical protein E8K88_16525 [Lampropedia aestuarii]